MACIHNQIEYDSGDVIQPNCTTRCTCQPDFSFDCQTQRCLADGPTCYGWGDPHYGSFDSRTFDFQGNCEYILSRPCNSDDFIITGSNTLWPFNPTVAVTSAVRVIVPSRGLEIYLTSGGGGTITINGVLQANNGDGVVHLSNGVQVLRTGGRPYIILTVSFPVTIRWDGSYRVDITVSSSWQGQLCGLCGNYNNDASDDFMLPDGSVTTSANEFGSSWLYANRSSTCGVPPPSPACTGTIMTTAQSRCNALSAGVFSVCNSVVNPTAFIDGCVLDYCLCSAAEREECYCNSLSTYTAACASRGVIIPNWRDSFCCKYTIK